MSCCGRASLSVSFNRDPQRSAGPGLRVTIALPHPRGGYPVAVKRQSLPRTV